MKMIPIKIGKKNLFLEYCNYDNNCIAIELVDKKGEPYLTLTTNIEGAELLLNDNECLIKTWSDNESVIPIILESEYFKDTGKRIRVSQWCEASIWEVVKKDGVLK